MSGTNGATLRYTASGRCVIDANQAGDARYDSAPQVQRAIAVTVPDGPSERPVPRPAGSPAAAASYQGRRTTALT